MPEQALYLKWRPQTFEDVLGQEHITRTLRNALQQDRIRHAYLFSGPRGTGKTSTARLLAKAVNCQHPDPAQRPCNACDPCLAVNEGRFLDLIEIDAASHTGVDDVRDLRDKIAFSPSEGRYKVYIIDEVHRFSGAAFDALLKTLEEPPAHAIFVLATTEFHKVPATIKSRCLVFEFRRVALAEIAGRLAQIAQAEGVAIEPAALELIAREGTGSVRDSISLLDQILADPGQHITLELTEQILGTASGQHIVDLAQALIAGDAAWGLDLIDAAVDSGADPRQLGRQIVDYLRQLVLVQLGGPRLPDVTQERRAVLVQQASAIGRRALLAAIRAFNAAANEIQGGGWQPQLPLELAFLESIKPVEEGEPEPSPRPRYARTQDDLPGPVRRAPEPGAPAAAPASSPRPKPAGPAPAANLAEVRSNWPAVQKQARKSMHTLPALLDHAVPRDIRGDELILAVQVPIFKQKIEAPEARQALEEALLEVIGVPLRVRVVLVDHEDEHRSSREERLAHDEILAFGINELGGELTELDE